MRLGFARWNLRLRGGPRGHGDRGTSRLRRWHRLAPGQRRGAHVAAALSCSPQPRTRPGAQVGLGWVQTRLWPQVWRSSGGRPTGCPPGQHDGEEGCSHPESPVGAWGLGPRKGCTPWVVPLGSTPWAALCVGVPHGQVDPDFLESLVPRGLRQGRSPGKGPDPAQGAGKDQGTWPSHRALWWADL